MDDLEYYINQFTWGISPDEYLTPDGACFDMENVDINKSSMCITAPQAWERFMNARPNWQIIAVSPVGEEFVWMDGVLADWRMDICCLFTFPMLWPKLLSSGGGQIVWHTRHNEIKTAIRGNAWSYPFWLMLNNKTFSLVNPDVLTGQSNKITKSDFTLWTGWAWDNAILTHSSWTASASVTVNAEYTTDNDYTVTNYQLFAFYVNKEHQWGFRVKVTADLDVFKRDDDDGIYKYDSTDNNQTKTWAQVTEDGYWRFCYAINGVHTSATWEIIPSEDFDGEIPYYYVFNQKNYLCADGDNNPNHLLSLDNCTVKDLGRAGMGVDTTDLQDRAVIAEWKGNYVVWAWNYAVILNTNIVKDGYQVKPFLDIILATSYEIMGITTFGDQITFYANSNGSGYQIVWDWASLYPNYTYTWQGQTFETVVSSLGYDYVTVRSSRNEMQYYVVNWPQRNLIWGSQYFLSELSWTFKTLQKEQARTLTQRDDQEISWPLWAMRCWQPVFTWIGWDLLVFGSKRAWISNAWYKPLSLGFKWESGTEWWLYAYVDCIWPWSWGWMWMYYTKPNWEHWLAQLYTWYWSSGVRTPERPIYRRQFSYTLNPIIGSHFLEKEVDKFFISYKLTNENWKIHLYAKVDDTLFWRIKPQGTVDIAKWDVYILWDLTDEDKLEFIERDGDYLVFRRIWQQTTIGSDILYRYKWEWTSTIYAMDWDNWINVGTLTYNGFDHNYENLMNAQVDSKLPFFHKIQFKIVCECIDEDADGIAWNYTLCMPPEIYSIYIPLRQHTVW